MSLSLKFTNASVKKISTLHSCFKIQILLLRVDDLFLLQELTVLEASSRSENLKKVSPFHGNG